MEHVVLGLLILRSLTLYELNQAFKQGLSMIYSASYGSLQTSVKGLLQKGWIVFEEYVDHGRNKKVYSITEKGRQAFSQWMLDEVPLNKLEVTALAKVYFLGLAPVEQRRLILLDILAKIEHTQESLNRMNVEIHQIQVPSNYLEIFRFQVGTLDYALGAHAFAREWFLELLKGLETPTIRT